MKKNLLLSIASLALLNVNYAEPSLFPEIGLRAGFDAEDKVNLTSYEAFGIVETDWNWDLTESIHLSLDIEAAAGGLSGEGETGFYARIAPIAEFHFSEAPVSLALSSGPSYYSEDRFDQFDLGGNFHFTTSLGLEWEVCESWTLSYRFQHTSNAHLDEPNPGLDMHTIGLAYSY